MNEMKGAKKFQVSKETLENSWWLLLSLPAPSWGNRSQKYMWQWEGRESKFSTHVGIFIGKTSLCLNTKKADSTWVMFPFTKLIQKSLKTQGIFRCLWRICLLKTPLQCEILALCQKACLPVGNKTLCGAWSSIWGMSPKGEHLGGLNLLFIELNFLSGAPPFGSVQKELWCYFHFSTCFRDKMCIFLC